MPAIDALKPRDCLPADWPDDQMRALLMRPLFDGESLGRCRFHHRRVSEYLAARWIATRIREGCPIPVLLDLLAEQVRRRTVLRPALQAVAAWLCIGGERWNQAVQRLVLETSPEIHLRYGDPGSLTIDYKRTVLKALVRKTTGRRGWMESEDGCLMRMASPELASDIADLVRDKTVRCSVRSTRLRSISLTM